MPGPVKPADPSHFICKKCGRTFNYSQREVTDIGDQCINCLEESGVSVVNDPDYRLVTWKRDVLFEAAKDYYDSALTLSMNKKLDPPPSIVVKFDDGAGSLGFVYPVIPSDAEIPVAVVADLPEKSEPEESEGAPAE